MGPSKTYGKGLVQKITPLPFDNALKYTIAKYYTPSGRCIQSVTYTGMSVRTSLLCCVISNCILFFIILQRIFLMIKTSSLFVVVLFETTFVVVHVIFFIFLIYLLSVSLFCILHVRAIFLLFHRLIIIDNVCVLTFVRAGGRDVIEVAMKTTNEEKKVTN